MPRDEAELLKKARDFDLATLSDIHDMYHGAVYRYVAFRVANTGVVDDIASEVFTRLLEALRQKKGPKEHIRSWLLGTASNLVNDYFRQRYRAPEVEMSEHIGADNPQPDQVVEQNLKEAALYRALAILTEEQQHVLALRFGDGLSIKEVAQQLNKSEGAIKMLQARAIATLGDRLELFGGKSHG